MPEQTDTITTKSTSYSVSPAPHNDSRYTWVLVVVGAVIVVALAVLLASSAATNNQTNSAQTTTIAAGTTQTRSVSAQTSNATNTTTTQAQIREYTVAGSSFAFSPSEITASRGDTVRVTFTNTGDHDHDFIVEGIAGAATSVLAPGASETIEFVVPANGPSSYKVYCGVGDHEDAGMVGTLRIV